MKKQLFQIPKTAAILSLVLVFGLSTAWAAPGKKSKNGRLKTYSDSIVIKQGRKSKNGTLKLVRHKVEANIWKKSLDSYLKDKGINEVQITCQVTEELINSDDGAYYKLMFYFGPSGTYFDVPLELTIKGKYLDTDIDLVLLDPDGNPFEGNVSRGKDKKGKDQITYEINHFSTYQYVSSSSKEVIDNYDHEWAATHYARKKIGVEGGNIKVNSEASVKINNDALAEYLSEQGVDSVLITVELYYGWDRTLLFVFGPSGAHFEPSLELTIEGGYIEDDMLFVGEDGELLEYTSQKKGSQLTFNIPHFSRYSYDTYDY